MHKLVACVALLAAGCASVPPRATELAVTQRVEHLDAVAREPMLAEHPQGALFVTGYWDPEPRLWKSQDRGATWSRVDVGPEAVGNSDVDLAVAADGTLYFVNMTYDREKSEGRQIAIGVSGDAGTSWRWTTLSKARFDDRPWVEVAPDGTAHVIWNDGSGVSHSVSRDRGASWTAPARIHDRGGSSHLAIGPQNQLAVRITPLSASGNQYDEGLDLIAVSSDGGASWQKRPAPGQRDWSPDFESEATPRWVERWRGMRPGVCIRSGRTRRGCAWPARTTSARRGRRGRWPIPRRRRSSPISWRAAAASWPRRGSPRRRTT